MPMSYDDYQNKRSWLVDTAETPAQKKRLKEQLAALEAKYKAQQAAPAKPLSGAAAIKAIQERTSDKGVAKAEADAKAAIAKKYPGLTIPTVKKGGKMLTPDLARSKNKNFGR